MSDIELDGLLKKQYELEKKVAELISKTVETSENSILRLLLDRLVLDSLKHADMIQVLLDLRKGTIISVAHREKMQEALKDHVAREKEMLRGLNDMVSRVHEPKIKFLLQHIVEDERKHHKLLDEVGQILGWRDATQEDWWDTIDRVEWTF